MPRKYDAPRREEQAAATRADIVRAAGELFAKNGYAATTMAAIAAAARVAPKTVYALGDKAHLLGLALDRSIAGDDDPTPLVDRPGFRAVLEARTGQEAARLGAALGAPMMLRLFPLYRAFEQAAATDPQIAQQWREYQERRRRDVRRIVDAVQSLAALRPGLDADRATDTLWALLGWHPVALLVELRGWGPEEVQAWIEDVFATVLLADGGPSQAPVDSSPGR